MRLSFLVLIAALAISGCSKQKVPEQPARRELSQQSAMLAWDASPESDVAGYRVHYGPDTGEYTEQLDVGYMTTAVVQNLLPDVPYFFVVTAYNPSGESTFSNEVSVGAIPSPSATPSITPSPTPVTPSPTTSPTPTPTVTATVTVTPTISPTPPIAATPTATVTASPTVTATPIITSGTLVNISSRAFVMTGEKVLIAGFIVADAPTRVAVRALGPSLEPFGIIEFLPDPVLELRAASGALIMRNNNWRESQEADIISAHLNPSSNLESVIILVLLPGSYTAIVADADGLSGVGIIEVYRLP